MSDEWFQMLLLTLYPFVLFFAMLIGKDLLSRSGWQACLVAVAPLLLLMNLLPELLAA